MKTGHIAVFGDSIAWGSWDAECGGWVQRLKREYMSRQNANPSPYGYVTVFECAVPGHKVADIRKRLVADLDAIEVDVVIVAIGINDAPHYEHRRGTPLADFERDYAFVLDECTSRTENTIALTATNAHERWLGWQNNDIVKVNNVIYKLCESRKIDVIDLFDLLNRGEVDKDGIHPNSTGHEKLFRTVLAHLDALDIKL